VDTQKVNYSEKRTCAFPAKSGVRNRSDVLSLQRTASRNSTEEARTAHPYCSPGLKSDILHGKTIPGWNSATARNLPLHRISCSLRDPASWNGTPIRDDSHHKIAWKTAQKPLSNEPRFSSLHHSEAKCKGFLKFFWILYVFFEKSTYTM